MPSESFLDHSICPFCPSFGTRKWGNLKNDCGYGKSHHHQQKSSRILSLGEAYFCSFTTRNPMMQSDQSLIVKISKKPSGDYLKILTQSKLPLLTTQRVLRKLLFGIRLRDKSKSNIKHLLL